jgi:hypothetical protein
MMHRSTRKSLARCSTAPTMVSRIFARLDSRMRAERRNAKLEMAEMIDELLITFAGAG